MLQAHPKLLGLEKKLSWFALIYGVLTIVTAIALPMFGQMLPPVGVAVWLLLGVGSMLAGYVALTAKVWGFWLLFLVFLVQLAEYHSQTFFFSFIGPFSVKFGWGWNDPPSSININLLAFVICSLAFHCAISLTERSSGSPTAPAEH
jgi:hypothetical protein